MTLARARSRHPSSRPSFVKRFSDLASDRQTLNLSSSSNSRHTRILSRPKPLPSSSTAAAVSRVRGAGLYGRKRKRSGLPLGEHEIAARQRAEERELDRQRRNEEIERRYQPYDEPYSQADDQHGGYGWRRGERHGHRDDLWELDPYHHYQGAGRQEIDDPRRYGDPGPYIPHEEYAPYPPRAPSTPPSDPEEQYLEALLTGRVSPRSFRNAQGTGHTSTPRPLSQRYRSQQEFLPDPTSRYPVPQQYDMNRQPPTLRSYPQYPHTPDRRDYPSEATMVHQQPFYPSSRHRSTTYAPPRLESSAGRPLRGILKKTSQPRVPPSDDTSSLFNSNSSPLARHAEHFPQLQYTESTYAPQLHPQSQVSHESRHSVPADRYAAQPHYDSGPSWDAAPLSTTSTSMHGYTSDDLLIRYPNQSQVNNGSDSSGLLQSYSSDSGHLRTLQAYTTPSVQSDPARTPADIPRPLVQAHRTLVGKTGKVNPIEPVYRVPALVDNTQNVSPIRSADDLISLLEAAAEYGHQQHPNASLIDGDDDLSDQVMDVSSCPSRSSSQHAFDRLSLEPGFTSPYTPQSQRFARYDHLSATRSSSQWQSMSDEQFHTENTAQDPDWLEDEQEDLGLELMTPTASRMVRVTDGAFAKYDIPDHLKHHIKHIKPIKPRTLLALPDPAVVAEDDDEDELPSFRIDSQESDEVMQEDATEAIESFSDDGWTMNAGEGARSSFQQMGLPPSSDSIQNFRENEGRRRPWGLSPVIEEEEENEEDDDGRQYVDRLEDSEDRIDDMGGHLPESVMEEGFFEGDGSTGFEIYRDGY